MATIAAGDLPLSATLTDDDRFMIIDAPGSTKAAKLVATTVVRASMQSGAVLSSSLGAVNGVAQLGADQKVLPAQLPASVSGVSSVDGLTGAVTGIVQTADVGVTVASLVAGKVPTVQLPGLVQTASRNNNASVSSVVDFNYEQNVILLNQNTTLTFSNLQPGAKTSLILVQDNTGFRNVTYPGANFAFDGGQVVNPYPAQITAQGFEVREDGLMIIGYGAALDSSEMWRTFDGQDNFGRDLLAGTAGSVITAGQLRWTYFKARRNLLATNIIAWANVASVGATHQFMCLATVDTNTWATTIAAITADDTTNATFGTATTAGTKITKALTGAYQVLAGRWYAFGACSIGHSTSPSLVSTKIAATNVTGNELPYMAGVTSLGAYPTVGTTYSWVTGPTIAVSDTLYYCNLK